MDDDPDFDLILRVRAGDANAFNEVAVRHRGALGRIALRYVKNPADAAEVAQETLMRAFERIASFRGESPFRSWLYRICVNVSLNRVRVADLSEPLDLVDDQRFTNSLGTTRLVAAELWRKVEQRIGTLPPKQRLAVELRLFHELAFDEIGGVMGTSEDAAKSSYHAGMKRLRGLVSTQ